MPQVTILSKPGGGCPQCDVAAEDLRDEGINYIKWEVDRDQLKKLTNRARYPQFMIGDEHIEWKDIQKRWEPLTMSEPGYTLFPIKYPDLYSLYKKQVASFWTVEEVDLKDDHRDWAELKEDERFFMSHILAFFAGSDGIVMENLLSKFTGDVKATEARMFYSMQAASEAIHSETYSLLIDTYITSPEEKTRLFNAIETIPCVKTKADWALQWMSEERPFAERLVAFACVEGILFSGAFCSIFWMKNRGKLPGLCFSNELISRDEALHTEFAVALWHHLNHKVAPTTVQDIVRGAVHCEEKFILDSLPCKFIGMDGDRMKEYIHFVADRLLKQLGVPALWNAKNPFPWMENISLDGKTNFFEKRVGEYSKHDTSGAIEFNEDF